MVATKRINKNKIKQKIDKQKKLKNKTQLATLNPAKWIITFTGIVSFHQAIIIDISTARSKWRLVGPALSGHLLYSLANHAYANRYHHHPVR